MVQIMTFITRLSEPDFLITYQEYLLVIILAVSFLEVVFPPIPGDTVLIIGSSISARAGIHPFLIIACAFIGTYSASLLLYKIGSGLEEKILESPRFSWWLDTKTFGKIKQWFERYGYWTLLLSRFLPIARSGVALSAGIVRYDRQRSVIALGLSVFLSSTGFVLIGRFIGLRWTEIYNLRNLSPAFFRLFPIIFILGGGSWMIRRRRRQKRSQHHS